jgi:hypothetical protein
VAWPGNQVIQFVFSLTTARLPSWRSNDNVRPAAQNLSPF